MFCLLFVLAASCHWTTSPWESVSAVTALLSLVMTGVCTSSPGLVAACSRCTVSLCLNHGVSGGWVLYSCRVLCMLCWTTQVAWCVWTGRVRSGTQSTDFWTSLSIWPQSTGGCWLLTLTTTAYSWCLPLAPSCSVWSQGRMTVSGGHTVCVRMRTAGCWLSDTVTPQTETPQDPQCRCSSTELRAATDRLFPEKKLCSPSDNRRLLWLFYGESSFQRFLCFISLFVSGRAASQFVFLPP